MLKTTQPVIIVTQRELDAMLSEAVKQAVAEALRHVLATTAKLAVGEALRTAPKALTAAPASTTDRFIRLAQVEQMIGLKKTAIYSMIKAGEFPAAVKIGKHATGWRESAIITWIEQR